MPASLIENIISYIIIVLFAWTVLGYVAWEVWQKWPTKK